MLPTYKYILLLLITNKNVISKHFNSIFQIGKHKQNIKGDTLASSVVGTVTKLCAL